MDWSSVQRKCNSSVKHTEAETHNANMEIANICPISPGIKGSRQTGTTEDQRGWCGPRPENLLQIALNE